MRSLRSIGLWTGVSVLCASAALAQDVRYEKYKLDNGMTVILHEDHSLPLATVNTWFRVGAQNEPPGRSGFAHLFEHLMFMGTQRVPGGEFDSIMEVGGGANNATTDLHRTNYFSWGPARLLPTLLWLDADRLEDMGLNMTQEKLDKQRDVVRNELRQTVENAPYGKAGEMIFHLMYPPGHPYVNGVIGTHEDLEAANVTNVKDFFANFYVPNNASLVVAGDFDPAVIKPLVAALFGTLPRGGDVAPRVVAPVALDKILRYTMIDKVQLPKLAMVYHSPRAFQEGDAEMSLAAAVLSEGKSSRLYKRLVYDEKLAAEVDATQSAYPLGSLFQVEVLAKPEADLERVEKIVDEELARFVKDGPTADELDRHKAMIERGMLASLQSIEAKADRLNEYEYYLGEPNSFKRDLDRYRAATPDAVRGWAARVLTPNARLILRVLPEEPEREESPRDKRPADLADKTFAPQAPQTFKLKNGVPVMLWSRNDLPLVAMELLIKPGGPLDSPQKAGLADLMTAMLDEGAGELDSLKFSEALQALGATFGADADQEYLTVSLSALKRNFPAAAALFADAIQRPRMEAKDWERVQSLHVDELKQADEEPPIVAARASARLLYGETNPYAWPTSGTLETVEKLSLEDVKAAHKALLNPTGATILIAGDLTADEARTTLDKVLGDWSGSGTRTAANTDYAIPAIEGLRVAIVDRPDAVQTVIRFEMPGVKYDDPQRVKLQLLNTLLGGSFTSRLNQNLREAHGYTYGARSRFSMEPSTGSFNAASSVRADATGAALREFLGELGRLRSGDVSDAEAEKARQQVRNDAIQAFAGLNALLGTGAELAAAGLPFETIAQDFAASEKITAAELNAIARSAIPLERGVLVLVGDKDLIMEQIKDLNLPTPVECDPYGVPLNAAR